MRSLRGDSTPKARQRLDRAMTVDESSLKGLRSEMAGGATPRKPRKDTPGDAVSPERPDRDR